MSLANTNGLDNYSGPLANSVSGAVRFRPMSSRIFNTALMAHVESEPNQFAHDSADESMVVHHEFDFSFP